MVSTTLQWELNLLDLQLIDMAFIEDLGAPFHDVTTATLFAEKLPVTTVVNIISKQPEPITLCGLPVVKSILEKSGYPHELTTQYQDGQLLPPGATLLTLRGSAQVLLSVERILLNFLQRLCAIATVTSRYVEKIHGTQARILDTRKTLPGFRHLEKYAVHCGGGVNHRMGLYDAMMVKDTHIDILGGIDIALARLPENIKKQIPVIVEVRDRDELMAVLNNGLHKVSRVLLDNMTPELMRECVALCEHKMPTEASGNISLENILTVAECGVDYISVGKLTHSAGSVDLSMKCEY